MGKTGVANLPLHGGKAPRWLFERMVKLSGQIAYIIIEEYSTDELLKRLSDPFWFQALGCVVGFDWHSSGLTTTLCGALKIALNNMSSETGLFVAGGKAKTALKTPLEIDSIADRYALNGNFFKYVSKTTARVDNVAIQDGYDLYHHNIFFTKEGNWCVIQQGLNNSNSYARRYHWLKSITYSFVDEPHSAIFSTIRHARILNLTDKKSKPARHSIVDFTNQPLYAIEKELSTIKSLSMPKRHYILPEDINFKRLLKGLEKISELKPSDFESLLGIKGVGKKTIRALSLISDIIYGKPPSFKDPALFSYAHGGKDGHPFPVEKHIYDESIEVLKNAIEKAKIGYYDKLRAFKKLHTLFN